MRDINTIIIHCSATPPSMDIGVQTIREWHVNERQWSDIGYHYVIKRNGEVQEGRPVQRPGAHVKHYNSDSVGVCWVGGVAQGTSNPEDNRTAEQSESLFALIQKLQEEYPGAAVLGHRDIKGVKKACPSFDVRTWYTQSCIDLRKNQKASATVVQSTTCKSSSSTISTLWTLLLSILRR